MSEPLDIQNGTAARGVVPTRQRVADVGILLSLATLLIGATLMCSCPGVFAIMAVSAAVAIVYGARIQRFFATGLLLMAIAGFIVEFRTKQHEDEQMRRIHERVRQQSIRADSGH